MMTISDDYAAALIHGMREVYGKRDELTAEPIDPRDLLILKLWDEVQALKAATSFLGGGIRPTRSAAG